LAVAIGWSTAVLLIFLLPGFLFLAGFASSERISRDTTPRSPIGQLAATVLVSFFTHAALNTLSRIVVLWPRPDLMIAMSALTAGVAGAMPVSAVASNVHAHLGWIAAYIGATCATGFLAGRAFGAIATMRMPRLSWFQEAAGHLVEHQWAYELFPVGQEGLTPTYAHPLTRSGHEGRFLLYSGPLHRCGLHTDGRFAYFILRRAECRVFRLAENRVELTPRTPVDSQAGFPADKSDSLDFLYVPDEELANVYFNRYSIVPLTKQDERALETSLKEATAPSASPATS
jgi:hypothetical protein